MKTRSDSLHQSEGQPFCHGGDSDRLFTPESASEMKRIEKLLKFVAVGDIKLVCYYLNIKEDLYSC